MNKKKNPKGETVSVSVFVSLRMKKRLLCSSSFFPSSSSSSFPSLASFLSPLFFVRRCFQSHAKGPLTLYNEQVRKSLIQDDSQQRIPLNMLQDLYERLQRASPTVISNSSSKPGLVCVLLID
jgi:hypothetical protein